MSLDTPPDVWDENIVVWKEKPRNAEESVSQFLKNRCVEDIVVRTLKVSQDCLRLEPDKFRVGAYASRRNLPAFTVAAGRAFRNDEFNDFQIPLTAENELFTKFIPISGIPFIDYNRLQEARNTEDNDVVTEALMPDEKIGCNSDEGVDYSDSEDDVVDDIDFPHHLDWNPRVQCNAPPTSTSSKRRNVLEKRVNLNIIYNIHEGRGLEQVRPIPTNSKKVERFRKVNINDVDYSTSLLSLNDFILKRAMCEIRSPKPVPVTPPNLHSFNDSEYVKGMNPFFDTTAVQALDDVGKSMRPHFEFSPKGHVSAMGYQLNYLPRMELIVNGIGEDEVQKMHIIILNGPEATAKLHSLAPAVNSIENIIFGEVAINPCPAWLQSNSYLLGLETLVALDIKFYTVKQGVGDALYMHPRCLKITLTLNPCTSICYSFYTPIYDSVREGIAQCCCRRRHDVNLKVLLPRAAVGRGIIRQRTFTLGFASQNGAVGLVDFGDPGSYDFAVVGASGGLQNNLYSTSGALTAQRTYHQRELKSNVFQAEGLLQHPGIPYSSFLSASASVGELPQLPTCSAVVQRRRNRKGRRRTTIHGLAAATATPGTSQTMDLTTSVPVVNENNGNIISSNTLAELGEAEAESTSLPEGPLPLSTKFPVEDSTSTLEVSILAPPRLDDTDDDGVVRTPDRADEGIVSPTPISDSLTYEEAAQSEDMFRNSKDAGSDLNAGEHTDDTQQDSPQSGNAKNQWRQFKDSVLAIQCEYVIQGNSNTGQTRKRVAWLAIVDHNGTNVYNYTVILPNGTYGKDPYITDSIMNKESLQYGHVGPGMMKRDVASIIANKLVVGFGATDVLSTLGVAISEHVVDLENWVWWDEKPRWKYQSKISLLYDASESFWPDTPIATPHHPLQMAHICLRIFREKLLDLPSSPPRFPLSYFEADRDRINNRLNGTYRRWWERYGEDVVAVDCEMVIDPKEVGEKKNICATVGVVDYNFLPICDLMVKRAYKTYTVTSTTTKLNGIDDRTLERGDAEPHEVRRLVEHALRGKLVLGLAMRRDFTCLGLDMNDFQVFDLNDEFWHENIAKNQSKLTYSLKSLMYHFERHETFQPQGKPHTALQDADAVMKIFKYHYTTGWKTTDLNNKTRSTPIPHSMINPWPDKRRSESDEGRFGPNHTKFEGFSAGQNYGHRAARGYDVTTQRGQYQRRWGRGKARTHQSQYNESAPVRQRLGKRRRDSLYVPNGNKFDVNSGHSPQQPSPEQETFESTTYGVRFRLD